MLLDSRQSSPGAYSTVPPYRPINRVYNLCLRIPSRRATKRRFSLLQGGWFEGWPGWYIDTQEGIARRVDKRVSPAAMRRLLRSPTIGEPMRELPRIIMQGLPKIALEVGAELPDLG